MLESRETTQHRPSGWAREAASREGALARGWTCVRPTAPLLAPAQHASVLAALAAALGRSCAALLPRDF